jgi:tetratricopeptide (TPR) repeat protein
VRALELGVAADPSNGALLGLLAGRHERAGDWAAAARVLRRAVDAAVPDPALVARLAEACRSMGAHEEALRVLDRAIAASPHDRDLRCMRATERETAGDDGGAAADLLTIGDATGRHRDAVVEGLGRIVDRGRLPAGDQAGALERLAVLAAREGAWDRAATRYGRLAQVLEETDGDGARLPRVVLALADACEHAGRVADAREPLERALRRLPGSVELARALERVCGSTGDRGRLSGLLAARAEGTADASEKAALWLRAATLATEEEGARAALPLIERARSADPESIEAALAYARACSALDRPRDALVVLREVVHRSAGKRPPLLANVYLEMGKSHLAVDELAEALDALKAGLGMDSRNGELAMLAGLVAVDLGDEIVAERALMAVATMATRLDSCSARPARTDRASACYHLAQVARGRGDLTKARRWVARAVSEDPACGAARALLAKLEGPATVGTLRMR